VPLVWVPWQQYQLEVSELPMLYEKKIYIFEICNKKFEKIELIEVG
jgi:hypothetical protein